MDKYVIFLTINTKHKIDNVYRSYIGIHKGSINNYLGDGVYSNIPSTFMYPKTPLQCAIKKYGTDAFKTTILCKFNSVSEAYTKWHELVNSSFIKQTHTYNFFINSSYVELYKPLYQFNLSGKLIKKWEHAYEAYDFYCVSPNRFYSCIREKFAMYNSYWAVTEKINVSNYTESNSINHRVYLYSVDGKMLYEFNSADECAEYLQCPVKDVLNYIKSMQAITKDYYVSNKMMDLFISKPRRNYKSQIFYVYKEDGTFIGRYKGKEVMNVIKEHSWNRISKIFSMYNNWYEDFYLSFTPVDKVPEKYSGVSIDVYKESGDFIETINSLKEAAVKYNIPAYRIKRIQQGNCHFNDYIFKYNSK